MLRPRKIFIALRLEYSSNRDFLVGIARYRKRHPNWRVTIIDQFWDFTDELMQKVVDNAYDGIITTHPMTRHAAELLSSTDIPLLVLGCGEADGPFRRRNAVFVRGNDFALGEVAARHFFTLGNFRSFGFVDVIHDSEWAHARADGFASALAAQGKNMTVIRSPYPDGSLEDLAFLREHIAALPKPTAILAAYDNRAVNIVEACDTAALAIPRHVSVIGVDDDAMLCEFTTPMLTSISPAQSRKGETGCAALDRLMRCKAPQPVSTLVLNDARVVERESTAPLAPAAHLIERAQRFIAERACLGILARDVVRHLGVSRALVDRRFREYAKTTLTDEINRVRLETVRRHLLESSLPIHKVTALSGFPTPQYAKRLFKRTFGLTMREFRATKKTTRTP